LTIVALLAGCGGGSGLHVSEQDVSRIVLRDRDLPPAFSAFASGAQATLDNAGTSRGDAARFGRKGGWIARYRRSGTVATRGPLVVESRADVFGDSGGAKRDLGLYRVDFSRVAGGKKVTGIPRIGDETIAVTFGQPGTVDLRFYRIAWRHGNVTAAVLAEGFEGKLTLAETVALAQKQDRLIVSLGG
jgi:hypothetical protein